MAEVDRAALTRECHVFARHIGTTASAQVCGKYVQAHEQGGVVIGERHDALDVLLLRSATSPLRAMLADVYARFTRPAGPLRRKLVLLAAILESDAPGYRVFEPPAASGAAQVLSRLGVRGLLFGLALAAAALRFGPAHLWLRLTRRTDAPPVLPAPPR